MQAEPELAIWLLPSNLLRLIISEALPMLKTSVSNNRHPKRRGEGLNDPQKLGLFEGR